MATEYFPESKCGDVSQPRCENNVTNKAVCVASVRDKSQVTEQPADVNKTDNREGYALQLNAIANAGVATKNPYQPGPCSSPRGSEITEAIPTVRIPA